ncbi:MAG: glycosyltransferase family 39 protein [Acidobacteriota bacterium]|nr:glycosyltransferase family 39 protein [Acidobacteriota bacterium]
MNPDNPGNRTIVAGWLVIAWFLFVGLGGYDLSAPDEPRFGLVAREMMENGNWLLPHRNERPYPDKPPLFFWSIAGFSYLTGGEVTPFSSRLPSALAALGVLLLLARWSGRRTALALMAPLVLISVFRFFFQAHMAQIDMLLCLFTTWASILGFEAMTGGRRRVRTMGILMGLGILAKGPVAMVIPMGAMAVYALFTGKRTWRQYPWQAMLWSLLPPLVWLSGLAVEVWLRDQWDYLYNLLFKQTLVRFVNPWHHYRPPWYYLKSMLTDFLPWWPLLLAAAPWTKARRAILSDKQRFCWAVVVWVLFFFSLSKGKRNLYIVPLYPFAAWLVADYMKTAIIAGISKKMRLVWAVPPLVLILTGVALTTLSLELFPVKYDLSTFPMFIGASVGGSITLAGLYALVQLFRPKPVRFLPGIIAAMLVAASFLYLTAMPWAEPSRSRRPFMETVSTILAEDTGTEEPLLAMVAYRSGFRFYGDRHIVELAPLKLDGKNPKLYGLPNLIEFQREHPHAYVILRQEFLEEYREAYPEFNPTVLAGREIGSGGLYVLIRCDDCLPVNPG